MRESTVIETSWSRYIHCLAKRMRRLSNLSFEFSAKIDGDLARGDRWHFRLSHDSIGVPVVYEIIARRWRNRRTKHGVREVIAVSAVPFSIIKCDIVARTAV